MMWLRLRWVGLIVILLAPSTQGVAAQGYSPPQEQTVAELRQNLETLLAFERQRQLFGLPPNPNLPQREIELLQADYNENILPGLMGVEQDCFFAEIPVKAALDWSHQVQILGLGEESGPLWEQASVVQDSLLKILKNCHKQMYQACVLDDGDPYAAFLPGVTRQLTLMDDDPSWEQKNNRCKLGWRGSLTSSETMQGNMSKVASQGAGTSATIKVALSGSRTMQIDLPGKPRSATGRVDASSTQNNTTVMTAGKCTTTFVQDAVHTASGSGEATLRKHSTDSGALVLNFSGPMETGTLRTSGRTTVNDKKCGVNMDLPVQTVPNPTFPWPGEVSDQLGDPYTELIQGTKTFYFVINSAGTLVPAQAGANDSISRVPAMPGATPRASEVMPWFSPSLPLQDAEGNPSIKVEIRWNLTFGEA